MPLNRIAPGSRYGRHGDKAGRKTGFLWWETHDGAQTQISNCSSAVSYITFIILRSDERFVVATCVLPPCSTPTPLSLSLFQTHTHMRHKKEVFRMNFTLHMGNMVLLYCGMCMLFAHLFSFNYDYGVFDCCSILHLFCLARLICVVLSRSRCFFMFSISLSHTARTICTQTCRLFIYSSPNTSANAGQIDDHSAQCPIFLHFYSVLNGDIGILVWLKAYQCSQLWYSS